MGLPEPDLFPHRHQAVVPVSSHFPPVSPPKEAGLARAAFTVDRFAYGSGSFGGGWPKPSLKCGDWVQATLMGRFLSNKRWQKFLAGLAALQSEADWWAEEVFPGQGDEVALAMLDEARSQVGGSGAPSLTSDLGESLLAMLYLANRAGVDVVRAIGDSEDHRVAIGRPGGSVMATVGLDDLINAFPGPDRASSQGLANAFGQTLAGYLWITFAPQGPGPFRGLLGPAKEALDQVRSDPGSSPLYRVWSRWFLKP